MKFFLRAYNCFTACTNDGQFRQVSILRALVRRVNIDESVTIDSIAKDTRTEGFTGADLSALVREAGLSVVKEWAGSMGPSEAAETSDPQTTAPTIAVRHFEIALQKVKPSVSAMDRKRWTRVKV